MAYTAAVAYEYSYVNVKQLLYEVLVAELMSSGMDEIRIYKSDPIDEAHIPGIGINKVALNENGTAGGLGLVSQQPTYDPDAKTYTTYSGTYMQETVEVRVFHFNPDDRDTLGITVLGVLFAVRSELEKRGVATITLSGGRDEQDNTIMSQPLFMHSIMMNYINPLDVQVVTTDAETITVDVTPDMLTGG